VSVHEHQVALAGALLLTALNRAQRKGCLKKKEKSSYFKKSKKKKIFTFKTLFIALIA